MSNQDEIIYFSHMPKCGGQSFKVGLEEAYGEAVQFNYLIPIPILKKKMAHLMYWRVKNRFKKINIPNNKQIVYGHICFDDLPKNTGKYIRYGIFFRDPIEWFGSYYFYANKKYPKQFACGPMDVILKYRLDNAFRLHLGEVQVKDLSFVGLQENYSESLLLFEKIFGKAIPAIQKNKTDFNAQTDNLKQKYREYFKSEGLLPDIIEAMEKNTTIYNEAIRRYQELLKENDL